MGWWPFGGGEKKPNMSAASRVNCYDNRDAYFECLEQNGDKSDRCKALEGKYRNTCLVAWQKYFDQQRETLAKEGKKWKSPNMEGEKGSLKPVRPPIVMGVTGEHEQTETAPRWNDGKK